MENSGKDSKIIAKIAEGKLNIGTKTSKNLEIESSIIDSLFNDKYLTRLYNNPENIKFKEPLRHT